MARSQLSVSWSDSKNDARNFFAASQKEAQIQHPKKKKEDNLIFLKNIEMNVGFCCTSLFWPKDKTPNEKWPNEQISNPCSRLRHCVFFNLL